MDFSRKLLDPAQFVRFYGTTPPREGSSMQDVERIATQFLSRLEGLDVDAIVVYDVQDESERTAEPRPFPFLPTLDTRVYAQVLEARSGLPVITYKCVGAAHEAGWSHWLSEAAQNYQTRALSLVGRASSKGAPSDWISLARATQIASERGFTVGGVAIAERHTSARSESEKIILKTQNGCRFFISQAIYRPEATIRMLRDYHADCEKLGISPQRIVLTFTPCGGAKTLQFLKWLGIAIDAETESAILNAENPLEKSVEICRESLRQILSEECCKYLPLGINVESVSSKKEEGDAARELFRALSEVARQASEGSSGRSVGYNTIL